MKNISTLAIVLILVAAAGGFFGGMKYQQSKTPVRQFGNGQNGNRGGQGRNGIGFRPVNGEIINADDKSITVKLADGSSKIVLLTDSTTISKSSDATKADLKTGEKVAVFGTDNSDRSVTAQNVQLNPMFRGMMGSPTPSR